MFQYKLSDPKDNFSEKLCPGDGYLKKLKHVEVHLADHCNLNCARCGHFCPLVKKATFPEKDALTKDLLRLKELTKDNEIESISLLGGEPLLNKDINYYLEFVANTFQNTSIELISNGILLDEMDDTFFELFKTHSNLSLMLSQYFEKDFYRKAEDFLKSKGFPMDRFWIFGSSRYNSTLFMNLSLVAKSELTEKEAFEVCPYKNHRLQLYKGKLYSCATAAYLHYYSEYFKDDIKAFEDDGVDIHGNDLTDILNFLNKEHKTCKYCNLDCFKAWYYPERSKRDSSEWRKE